MAMVISKAKRQIRPVDFKTQMHVYEDEALDRMVAASKDKSGDETWDRDYEVEDIVRRAIAEFIDQEEKEAARKEKAARDAAEADARKPGAVSMPNAQKPRNQQAA